MQIKILHSFQTKSITIIMDYCWELNKIRIQLQILLEIVLFY